MPYQIIYIKAKIKNRNIYAKTNIILLLIPDIKGMAFKIKFIIHLSLSLSKTVAVFFII